MLRQRKIYILFVLALILYSCSPSKEIFGTYRSNYAINGVFRTRVDLRSDSTFSYKKSGDLMYDTATGLFQIEGRYIKLTYDPPKPDSSEFYRNYSYDTKWVSDPGKNVVKEHVNIAQLNAHRCVRPTQYILASGKLYCTDEKGELVTKSQKISRYKKYLFWGTRYTKRKYYLEKL